MVALFCRILLILALVVVAGAYAVIAERSPAAVYLLIFLLVAWAWRRVRRGRNLWSHGTARSTGIIDLLRQRMLDSQGLILGRVGSAEPPSFFQGAGALLSPVIPNRVACQAFLSWVYKRKWATDRIIRVSLDQRQLFFPASDH